MPHRRCNRPTNGALWGRPIERVSACTRRLVPTQMRVPAQLDAGGPSLDQRAVHVMVVKCASSQSAHFTALRVMYPR